MAESNRCCDFRMHHAIALTDPEMKMQFSAMCVDLPDGTMCVAFRGTDNTIVGWREDFDMAYQTIVPAQEAAVYYLAQAAASTGRPLRIVGHSKGGNLAMYASSLVGHSVQDGILEIDSFDGPGMNTAMAVNEGYLRIKPKIRSYIPQSSIIGLLMEYVQPYTVVRSTVTGIHHDPENEELFLAVGKIHDNDLHYDKPFLVRFDADLNIVWQKEVELPHNCCKFFFKQKSFMDSLKGLFKKK